MQDFEIFLQDNLEILNKNIDYYIAAGLKPGDMGRLFNGLPDYESVDSLMQHFQLALDTNKLDVWYQYVVGLAVNDLFDTKGELKPAIKKIFVDKGISETQFTDNQFKVALITGYITNMFGLKTKSIVEPLTTVLQDSGQLNIDNPEEFPNIKNGRAFAKAMKIFADGIAIDEKFIAELNGQTKVNLQVKLNEPPTANDLILHGMNFGKVILDKFSFAQLLKLKDDLNQIMVFNQSDIQKVKNSNEAFTYIDIKILENLDKLCKSPIDEFKTYDQGQLEKLEQEITEGLRLIKNKKDPLFKQAQSFLEQIHELKADIVSRNILKAILTQDKLDLFSFAGLFKVENGATESEAKKQKQQIKQQKKQLVYHLKKLTKTMTQLSVPEEREAAYATLVKDYNLPEQYHQYSDANAALLASRANKNAQLTIAKLAPEAAELSGPFGKGLFERINAYRKKHPVKFWLIVGGIALATAAVITGLALTGVGLAAAAAATTAGVAAAATTATTTLSTLFTGAAVASTAVVAGTTITAEVAIAAGTALTLVGVAGAAASVTALGKESYKLAMQGEVSKKDEKLQKMEAEPKQNKTVKDNPPKQTELAPKASERLGLKSPRYAELNQIYSEAHTSKFGKYSVVVGGAVGLWQGIVTDNKSVAEFLNKAELEVEVSPWKIHVSVHPDDLAQAWDLIYPILEADSNFKFKVARLNVLADKREKLAHIDPAKITELERKQALEDGERMTHGMQITIYMPHGKEQSYQVMLQKIETTLYENGVRPGVTHQSDKSVGLYSSIRMDKRNGIAVSYDQVSIYKDVIESDVFESVEIDWQKAKSIDWSKIDFTRHQEKTAQILKAYEDIQAKYEVASAAEKSQIKKEFSVLRSLTIDYFARWHKALNHLNTENNEISADLKTFKAQIDENYHKFSSLENIRSVEVIADVNQFDDSDWSPPTELPPLPPGSVVKVAEIDNLIARAKNEFVELSAQLKDINSSIELEKFINKQIQNYQYLYEVAYDSHQRARETGRATKEYEAYLKIYNLLVVELNNLVESKKAEYPKLPVQIDAEKLSQDLQMVRAVIKLVAHNYLLGVKNNPFVYTESFLNMLDPKGVESHIGEIPGMFDTESFAKFRSLLSDIDGQLSLLAGNVEKIDRLIAEQKQLFLLIQQFENRQVKALLLASNVTVTGELQSHAVLAAIAKINNFESTATELNQKMAELRQYLQVIGVQGLGDAQLSTMIQLIEKPKLLNKLNNAELRAIIAVNPQINLLATQVDELNNLHIAGLNYGSFHAKLNQILKWPIKLSEQEFLSIRAENQVDLLAHPPANLSQDTLDNEFNDFIKDFQDIHKKLSDLNKRQNIPFYNKLKNIFRKATVHGEVISLAEFSDIGPRVENHRAWLNTLTDIQAIKDRNKVVAKMGAAGTVYLDFAEKNIDAINKYATLLNDTDVLLANGLIYFAKQVFAAIENLKLLSGRVNSHANYSIEQLTSLQTELLAKQKIVSEDVVSINKIISVLENNQALKNVALAHKLKAALQEAKSLLQLVSGQLQTIESKIEKVKAHSPLQDFAKKENVALGIAVAQSSDAAELIKTKGAEAGVVAGASFVQVNPEDHSKVVMPVDAHGLAYQISMGGRSEYRRSSEYIDNLSSKQKGVVAKRGYTDDEKKIIEHMVLNTVAELLKSGETRFTVVGEKALCEKAAKDILAILPSAKIFINDSNKPFKPSLGRRLFEVLPKRKDYQEKGLTAEEVLESKLKEGKGILDMPTKSPGPRGRAT